MQAQTIIDPVSILNSTDESEARLVAWMGGVDVPFGYWPTDDRDAFEEAIREWVRREPAEFGYTDDEHASDEATDGDRVERYMAAITIEPKVEASP